MREEGFHRLCTFVGEMYGIYTYNIREMGAQFEREAGKEEGICETGNRNHVSQNSAQRRVLELRALNFRFLLRYSVNETN
jgi:hypothetical protein